MQILVEKAGAGMKKIDKKIVGFSVKEGEVETPEKEEVLSVHELLKRPLRVNGMTFKVKPPAAEHACYVTFNYMFKEGKLQPIEMFINSKDSSHLQWSMTVTRLVSAIFRHGSYSFVVEEFNSTFAADGGYWKTGGGGRVNSIMHHIGQCLEEFLDELDRMNKGGQVRDVLPDDGEVGLGQPEETEPESGGRICPKCNHYTMMGKGGCWECSREKCGYSTCEES